MSVFFALIFACIDPIHGVPGFHNDSLTTVRLATQGSKKYSKSNVKLHNYTMSVIFDDINDSQVQPNKVEPTIMK